MSLPVPTVSLTDGGADVTYRGVVPDKGGPPIDITVRVEWIKGVPAITGLYIPQSITIALVNDLNWVELRSTSYREAAKKHLRKWSDPQTKLSYEEAVEASRMLRPSLPEFSAAIATLCRWATASGSPRIKTLIAATGRTDRVNIGYLAKATARFAETGDPRFDPDGKAL